MNDAVDMYQKIADEEGITRHQVKALAFPIIYGMHRQLTTEVMWDLVRENVRACKNHIGEFKEDL